MAEHQLGHTEEAPKWLAKDVQQTKQELADNVTPWNRRTTLELLRDEATEPLTKGELDALWRSAQLGSSLGERCWLESRRSD